MIKSMGSRLKIRLKIKILKWIFEAFREALALSYPAMAVPPSTIFLTVCTAAVHPSTTFLIVCTAAVPPSSVFQYWVHCRGVNIPCLFITLAYGPYL